MGKQAKLKQQRRQEGFEKLQRERERDGLVKQGRLLQRWIAQETIETALDFEFEGEAQTLAGFSALKHVDMVIDGTSLWDSNSDHARHYAPNWKFENVRPPIEGQLFIEFENVYLWCEGASGYKNVGLSIMSSFNEVGEVIYNDYGERFDEYIILYFFVGVEDAEHRQRIETGALHGWLYVSNDGELISCTDLHTDSATVDPMDCLQRLLGATWNMLNVLAFLNCRNVELIDHAPEPSLSERYEREFGVPMTTYKTLRIKPVRKQYEGSDTDSEHTATKKRLHIVRGHIATYTDEAPLFGKYTGQYWIPAHVRGDEQRGMVVKDYEVEAPAM